MLFRSHEPPGGVGEAGAQPADLGNRRDRRQGLGCKSHPALRAGGTQRRESAGVFFDQNAVAVAQRDVKIGIVVQILKPDLALHTPAQHCDLSDFGHNGQPPGCAPHRARI